jgi:hypothetical protein
MKKYINSIRNAPYAIGAFLAVSSMSAGSAFAASSEGIGETAKNLKEDVGQVGQLIVAGGFMGGIVMLATGLMKLKQAAETQGQQVKYSEGMWRVAVGAGLVGIPAFAGMLTNTFGLGEVDMTQYGDAKF